MILIQQADKAYRFQALTPTDLREIKVVRPPSKVPTYLKVPYNIRYLR